jgi:hypothetical protein
MGRFDIALVSHYPVDIEMQKMVKYYIYDERNDMVPECTPTYVWFDCSRFYFELSNDSSTRMHHSFAVFLSMTNAVKMLKEHYDSFFYIESDCTLSDTDVQKLKDFKILSEENKKDATFFMFVNFLATWTFYCKMDFFKNTFTFTNTPEEYVSECKKINSYGILEDYFFKKVQEKNLFDKIHFINGTVTDIDSYFNTSAIAASRVIGSEVAFDSPYGSQYTTGVVRIHNTSELAFIYSNQHEGSKFNDGGEKVYLDGELIAELHDGKYTYASIIFPKNEFFTIKIGKTARNYSKSMVLNPSNKSYVYFKS